MNITTSKTRDYICDIRNRLIARMIVEYEYLENGIIESISKVLKSLEHIINELERASNTT